MKQAIASPQEQDRVIRWAFKLQALLEGNNDSIAILTHVRKMPNMNRVLHGYQVLVKNCADPDLDYLEFNPRLRAAMSSFDSARDDGGPVA